MESLDPNELSIQQLSKLMLGGITPRPIALVSSLSAKGVSNLAPFSFFNVFGYRPPVLGFSPANRGRDGSYKDTYLNIDATKECVVQLVTHSMGEQISLASGEFDSEVDEFVKSGLTPIKSDLVAPDRVKESPFQMECKLKEIINLGEGPASGNLILCEVVRIHINKELEWENGIDPVVLDTIGRLGGAKYIRMDSRGIYEIEKPKGKSAMGFEGLPKNVIGSKILTGNNLAQLASCESIPEKESAEEFRNNFSGGTGDKNKLHEFIEQGDFQNAFMELKSSEGTTEELWHKVAKIALDQGEVSFAWNVLKLENLQE